MLHAGFPQIHGQNATVQKVPDGCRKRPHYALSAACGIYCPESLWQQPNVPVPRHPWQHQQLLPAKEKAASEVPSIDTAWGQGSVWVPPAERECGQRLPCWAMVPPYPYPTASQVGKQHYVGREWVYPKRGGPGFYLMWIYTMPLMLVGLAGRLEHEPCDNKVKASGTCPDTRLIWKQGFYGAAEQRASVQPDMALCSSQAEAANKWARKNCEEKEKLWFSAKPPVFSPVQCTKFCEWLEISAI